MFKFEIPRAQYKKDGTKVKHCLKKGSFNRRHIRSKTVQETVLEGNKIKTVAREYTYHATKGWRRRRDY